MEFLVDSSYSFTPTCVTRIKLDFVCSSVVVTPESDAMQQLNEVLTGFRAGSGVGIAEHNSGYPDKVGHSGTYGVVPHQTYFVDWRWRYTVPINLSNLSKLYMINRSMVYCSRRSNSKPQHWCRFEEQLTKLFGRARKPCLPTSCIRHQEEHMLLWPHRVLLDNNNEWTYKTLDALERFLRVTYVLENPCR